MTLLTAPQRGPSPDAELSLAVDVRPVNPLIDEAP